MRAQIVLVTCLLLAAYPVRRTGGGFRELRLTLSQFKKRGIVKEKKQPLRFLTENG